MDLNQISLSGNSLVLNFINTVHNRNKPYNESIEYLKEPDDIFVWADILELLPDDKKIPGNSSVKEFNLKNRFKELIKFRELLFSIFSAIANESEIEETQLSLFNRYLKRYYSSTELVIGENYEIFECITDYKDRLEFILLVLIKDARNLLLNENQNRIKSCPNCGWIFLDKTKGKTKKWCSMKDCGNNIKSLNWYNKHKKK